MSGSVKLVYAIVYALFLGFSLDFGSSMYLLFDRYQSALQRTAITILNPTGTLSGAYTVFHPTPALNASIPWTSGLFTFVPAHMTGSVTTNHFLSGACLRPENPPWFLRGIPKWWLFFMVPVYVLNSGMRNLQPVSRKRKDVKQLAAMLVMAGASYAGAFDFPSFSHLSSPFPFPPSLY